MIDICVGETREAVVEGGRIVELRVRRASHVGRLAELGEIYSARVRTVDARRRGAYLDLGLKDDQGFLPLEHKRGKPPAVREGESVIVSVTREGVRGKNPVVSLMGRGQGEPCGRIEPASEAAASANDRPVGPDGRARIDAALEDALARVAPLTGGGALQIEPTAALVAIDVDARGREGPSDPEKFALDLNLAALSEAVRQLRLRALGGLIVFDFVALRTDRSRKALEAAAKAAFLNDPWGVTVGGLSRFGLLECARAQRRRPLHEIMRDDQGRPTAESLALDALRAIEREARAIGGRQIKASVSAEVMSFLDRTDIQWRHQLTARIGPRWTLDIAPTAARERIDVRAV